MSEDLEFNCGGNSGDGWLIYTVTQVSGEIKLILEDSYPTVWMRGEISILNSIISGTYISISEIKMRR